MKDMKDNIKNNMVEINNEDILIKEFYKGIRNALFLIRYLSILKLNGIIDNFINDVNSVFKEFLYSKTIYDIGIDKLDQYSDQFSISPMVGINLSVEPIPMPDIKEFRVTFPSFIYEVYHGKFVQSWIYFVEDIFSFFLDLHFEGKRTFKEFEGPIKLDFKNIDIRKNINALIKDTIIDDFNNKGYVKKFKLINDGIFKFERKKEDEFTIVRNNVEIRNLIQHNKGIVDISGLKKLGSKEIKIMDKNGEYEIYREHDKIILSIPEIFEFKRSIIFIAQLWRSKNEIFDGSYTKT